MKIQFTSKKKDVTEAKKYGFSSAIMNMPIVKKYVVNSPGGWFGSSVRNAELDAYIETEFFKLTPPDEEAHMPEILAAWLTSTGARHFGDMVSDEKGIDARKKVIKKNVKTIYNDGWIYSHPDQDGSLASTVKLRTANKDKLFAI